MTAYALLYRLRAAAEAGIVECDRELALRFSYAALYRRAHLARLAMRFHARIERLELRYA